MMDRLDSGPISRSPSCLCPHLAALFTLGNMTHLQFPSLADMAQAKNSPLLQDFLGEGLPQEIMETFSKDGLWNSNLGEAYMGESWLDSLVGDPESFLRSDIVTNMASSTEYKSRERRSGLSPQSLLFTGEDSVIHDLPEESLMPNKSQECRNDFGSHSDQSQQDIVQGGEKPYKCSECEKHFSRSCHLIQHWIIHMSENPTVNEEYENSFDQSSCFFCVSNNSHRLQILCV